MLEQFLSDAISEEIVSLRRVELLSSENARDLERTLMQQNYIGGIEFPDSYVVCKRERSLVSRVAATINHTGLFRLESNRATRAAGVCATLSRRASFHWLAVWQLANELYGGTVRARATEC